MNKQTLPVYLLFTLALALALVPAVAAQEEGGNMLTDGLSNIWSTLSGYGAQASDYVGSHVPEVAAIGTTSTLAGGFGLAYKSASAAKNKLQSAISGLTGQVTSAKEEAAKQIEAQTASLTKSASEQLSKLKADSQVEISKYSSQLETLNKEKANLLLNKESLEQQLKTAQDKLSGALAASQKII